MTRRQTATAHGFDTCAVCRAWFEASLGRRTAVGFACDRCRERLAWTVRAERAAAEATEPIPLDQQKRRAGHAQLPGVEGA